MGDAEPPPPPASTPAPPPEAGAEAYSAWVFEQLQHHDGVIFDCDGTLVDSMPRHYLAWEKATSAHGIPFPPAEFYATAGMPAAAILRTLIATHLPDTPPSDVPALIDRIVAAKAVALGATPPPAPIPAVLAVVTAARAAGLAVSVASGGARVDVAAALASAGIADWFAATVCAEDVAHGKPAPDVFLAAAAGMGCPPGARVMGLEDADMGLQALRAAGMTGVDVRRMHGYPLPPKQ